MGLLKISIDLECQINLARAGITVELITGACKNARVTTKDASKTTAAGTHQDRKRVHSKLRSEMNSQYWKHERHHKTAEKHQTAARQAVPTDDFGTSAIELDIANLST